MSRGNHRDWGGRKWDERARYQKLCFEGHKRRPDVAPGGRGDGGKGRLDRRLAFTFDGTGRRLGFLQPDTFEERRDLFVGWCVEVECPDAAQKAVMQELRRVSRHQEDDVPKPGCPVEN